MDCVSSISKYLYTWYAYTQKRKIQTQNTNANSSVSATMGSGITCQQCQHSSWMQGWRDRETTIGSAVPLP